MESQNSSSWKGSIRITESKLCLGQDHLKLNQLSVVQKLPELGAVSVSLGSLFQALSSLWLRTLFLLSHLNMNTKRQLCSLSLGPVAGPRRGSSALAPQEEGADSDGVTPQPSLLPAEQAKWPQLLLPSPALGTFHHPGPLLWTHSSPQMSFVC